MAISVLIVDDEPLAREGLRLLLAADPAFGPVALARGGREAVERIRGAAPELVLLDVQMPELDGFGVIAEIGVERMPPVVFVTAHDQYAIAAFEISAVDYLLKPVTAARFAKAMARAKLRLLGAAGEDEPAHLPSRLRAVMASREPFRAGRGPERIAVRDGDAVRFVAVEDIEWLQGAENYVELHLVAAPETYLIQVTMSALERSLDPGRFLRVHRSAIVQLARVTEARPIAHGEYQLTLASGARVRTGRTYHERLKALLRNPF